MARLRWLDRSFPVLGGRVPAPVALLIVATFLASIAGSLSAPGGLGGLLDAGVLIPSAVFHGEVWRLLTWPLFQLDPIGLIFGALGLFWFGSELVRVWGSGRFLLAYFGLAAATGLATCLVALGFPPIRSLTFVGMWPMVSALIIAWATYFPGRDVFVYFVLPLRGQNLIYATLGGTLLFALLPPRIPLFVPHFAAQLLMMAAMRGTPLGQIWARLKYELAYRRWRRRASKLKAVPPASQDETPRWYH
jgi:membrane associated rhomboid family serine protease